MDYPEINIYTTPTCQYCDMAKKYFNRHGVDYNEHDVADDEEAREEMVDKSHQLGVPVIEVGSHIFVGFNRKEIGKFLGIEE